MGLKIKELYLGTIVIFLLGFIIHNLYDWIPNYLVSLFSPKDESVWQHMKLFFTGVLLWSIIDLVVFKNRGNNYIFARCISIITMIIFIYVTWYPIYLTFGENMIVTLIFFFISIFVGQYVGYRIMEKEDLNYDDIAVLLFFVIWFSLLQ